MKGIIVPEHTTVLSSWKSDNPTESRFSWKLYMNSSTVIEGHICKGNTFIFILFFVICVVFVGLFAFFRRGGDGHCTYLVQFCQRFKAGFRYQISHVQQWILDYELKRLMESDSAQVHIERRIQPLMKPQVRVVENVELGDIYWRIRNWLKEL